jgi:hypothetical protein
LKIFKNIFAMVLLLLFVLPFADAQEEPEGQEAPEAVYVIRNMDFNVTGRTRPSAIIYYGEFQEGLELRGGSALEKYIRDKTQVLLNQRVLDEARIEYTLGEAEADGKIPVHLLISVKDTWNIIAVPYPKYDTNTGFDLTIKARDYNFFGSMIPLRIDLGYKYDEQGKNSAKFEIDSDIPFRAWGYNWNLDFDHFFAYRPDVEEPFYYKTVTGLSMELPVKRTTFTFGFSESFLLNEENSDRDKLLNGEFQNGPYMASELYSSWKIPTGLEIADSGELTYTPELSAVFNYGFPAYPLDPVRVGPFLNFEHTLGFDRIDWIGNYRRGFAVSLNNSYTWDFYRTSKNVEALDMALSFYGTGHFIISDHFGISGRLQYRQWFYHNPAYYGEAADKLRGIRDKSIQADYMLSLNLDFPVKVLSFLPSQWFGKPKLRFFDFDFHISPIIDLALYHDPATGTAFSPRNMLVSGGAEFIVFPAFMRSLYLRLSFAWNIVEHLNNPSGSYLPLPLPVIPKLPGGDNREIILVIGHHY